MDATYCDIVARSRIIFNRANICLHINVNGTRFLICAPHFDLAYTVVDSDQLLQNHYRTAGQICNIQRFQPDDKISHYYPTKEGYNQAFFLMGIEK